MGDGVPALLFQTVRWAAAAVLFVCVYVPYVAMSMTVHGRYPTDVRSKEEPD